MNNVRWDDVSKNPLARSELQIFTKQCCRGMLLYSNIAATIPFASAAFPQCNFFSTIPNSSNVKGSKLASVAVSWQVSEAKMLPRKPRKIHKLNKGLSTIFDELGGCEPAPSAKF